MRLKRILNLAMPAILAIIGALPVRLAVLPAHAASPEANLLYVGTYSGNKSKGIYSCRMNPATGQLSVAGLAAESANPTFLALHPSQRFLYAANEVGTFEGKRAGAVSAFAIDAATGKLSLINQKSSGGPGPCHLAVDATGKNLLVANYGGGSISVLPIQPDGSIGESTAFIQHAGSGVNSQRQEGPHAHYIDVEAGNRYAFVADLGLDKVLVYQFDARRGTLQANNPAFVPIKPGAGPRHLAFHPKGRFAYVINELDSTVTAFACDSGKGVLKEMQTVTTLPVGFTNANTTAEVVVHPKGKFLYGSNRGHDSIVVYAIDGKGMLQWVEHQSTQGRNPRNFAIDPTGQFLLAANQNSDNVIVFRIDPDTGKLTNTGHKAGIGAPVCVVFLSGKK